MSMFTKIGEGAAFVLGNGSAAIAAKLVWDNTEELLGEDGRGIAARAILTAATYLGVEHIVSSAIVADTNDIKAGFDEAKEKMEKKKEAKEDN